MTVKSPIMQRRPIQIVCTILLFLTSVLAYHSFDTIQPVSVNAFECLEQADSSDVYFVGRVFQSNGLIDTQGVQNIKNANAAGFDFADAYLFPCTTASCPSGASQVQAVADYLKQQGLRPNHDVRCLWLDIEIFHWSSNITQNQAFIEDMAKTAKKIFGVTGIYTTASAWNAIVGSSYNEQSKVALWWPSYDGQQNFDNFVPFGGWTKPCIKQYSQNVNVGCGVIGNQNFYSGC